ncbi:MAG: hypothetical protein MJZ22_01965 [Candidatus Saccharibacteria bacterium]|nr:hypothetical protein [Candidatus Saccharibacteria bacterium]
MGYKKAILPNDLVVISDGDNMVIFRELDDDDGTVEYKGIIYPKPTINMDMKYNMLLYHEKKGFLLSNIEGITPENVAETFKKTVDDILSIGVCSDNFTYWADIFKESPDWKNIEGNHQKTAELLFNNGIVEVISSFKRQWAIDRINYCLDDEDEDDDFPNTFF